MLAAFVKFEKQVLKSPRLTHALPRRKQSWEIWETLIFLSCGEDTKDFISTADGDLNLALSHYSLEREER